MRLSLSMRVHWVEILDSIWKLTQYRKASKMCLFVWLSEAFVKREGGRDVWYLLVNDEEESSRLRETW